MRALCMLAWHQLNWQGRLELHVLVSVQLLVA